LGGVWIFSGPSPYVNTVPVKQAPPPPPPLSPALFEEKQKA